MRLDTIRSYIAQLPAALTCMHHNLACAHQHMNASCVFLCDNGTHVKLGDIETSILMREDKADVDGKEEDKADVDGKVAHLMSMVRLRSGPQRSLRILLLQAPFKTCPHHTCQAHVENGRFKGDGKLWAVRAEVEGGRCGMAVLTA